MKVAVNILGRFHFFDLAKQLEKHGVLHQMVTSYPKFKAIEWSIKDEHINSLVHIEVIKRLLLKSKLHNQNIDYFIKKYYGFLSKKYIKNDIDIYAFYLGNSFSSNIVKQLKQDGKICIGHEGSSHILYNISILEKEYNKFGLKFNKPNSKAIEETIKEYDECNFIVANSSFVKRSFLEYGYPEEKVIMVNTGVDISQFRQIEKEDKVFRIIIAGGATLRKGYHYLLQAFYELNLPNAEVWHLGKINNEIIPFLNKYKTDKWILKGHLPQKELYKYYSQGDVFVLPSLEEGLAMVQAQAMACGLPLVCTTNTGGEDFISKDGEEGFVVPIRDVEALKEKILYLYENRNICYEMGQKAKKRVLTGFTWDDYGNKIINEYNKILNTSKNF